jgi:hypothetical protein
MQDGMSMFGKIIILLSIFATFVADIYEAETSELPPLPIVIIDCPFVPEELADWHWHGNEPPSNVIIHDNVDFAYLWDGFEVRLARAGDIFMGLDAEEVNSTFAEFDDGRMR